MTHIPIQNQKGFTLLIAIVTTSILLIVSFAVSNIVLKQITAIYAGKQSQVALYAAESGIECAMYWDLKNGTGISAFVYAGDPPKKTPIRCYNNSDISISDGATPEISTFTVDSLPGGGCAIVNVIKQTVPEVKTTIESRGYNTCSSVDRRFERALVVAY